MSAMGSSNLGSSRRDHVLRCILCCASHGRLVLMLLGDQCAARHRTCGHSPRYIADAELQIDITKVYLLSVIAGR